MIISNNQIRNLLVQYSKQNTKVTPKNQEEIQKAMQRDKIIVSHDAQAFLIAKEAIKNIPDIREDKLAEIEKRVQAGTYAVSDEEIAEKMIGRSLVDKLV